MCACAYEYTLKSRNTQTDVSTLDFRMKFGIRHIFLGDLIRLEQQELHALAPEEDNRN